MASKRRVRRKACGVKIRHDTRALAMRHYAELKYKRGAQGLKVYHCKWCQKWHVGHWKRV